MPPHKQRTPERMPNAMAVLDEARFVDMSEPLSNVATGDVAEVPDTIDGVKAIEVDMLGVVCVCCLRK